jgi:hypothetical protein
MNATGCSFCGGTEDHDWLCAEPSERIRLTAADWLEVDRPRREVSDDRADYADEWADEERAERERAWSERGW